MLLSVQIGEITTMENKPWTERENEVAAKGEDHRLRQLVSLNLSQYRLLWGTRGHTDSGRPQGRPPHIH